MSKWTHVNASIRFDGLTNKTLPTKKELGIVCKYGDEDESRWENPDLPCGSEGSIDYRIIKNPDKDCVAAMVVVFWGDLRDYDNIDEILQYFEEITIGKDIRSGILEIDVEFREILIYRYNQDTEKWVRCV